MKKRKKSRLKKKKREILTELLLIELRLQITWTTLRNER